jgi:glycerophosphoryl diester phosphodiesterase
MIRRSFLTRTLGAIAGAVCAPFVGKVDPLTDGVQYVQWPPRGPIEIKNWTFRYQDPYADAGVDPLSQDFIEAAKKVLNSKPLTQEQRDA